MTRQSITSKKLENLQKRLLSLGVCSDDFEESFIIMGGSGGQKRQKTASGVQLKYKDGKIIKCQEGRYRELNRYYARQRLCDYIEEKTLGKKSLKQLEIEKKRKQKKRRSRRQKVED
ncbi:peptide chain release factor-like protein [Candidatus Marinamargulisbacteria bacterium SCGC AG-439-L15]|nr:peptide chain release factor-like protein [Candidatus Marinamargulisbacteria bacterium SCGC AG-439-L15]